MNKKNCFTRTEQDIPNMRNLLYFLVIITYGLCILLCTDHLIAFAMFTDL